MALPTNHALIDFTELLMGARLPEWQRPLFTELLRRPRFRKSREVHARRARVLRKRGESVWFVRWSPTGRCVYAWGGPRPETISFQWPPPHTRPTRDDLLHIDYHPRYFFVDDLQSDPKRG